MVSDCLVACVIYCHIYLTRFSKDLHKQIDFRPQLLKVEDKLFIRKKLFLKVCLASKLFPEQLVQTPLHSGSGAHQPCLPLVSKQGENKGTLPNFSVPVSDTSAMPLCLKTIK